MQAAPRWLTRANGLTLCRALLIWPLLWAIYNHHWPLAALLFTLAVITDIYDGKLARKYNQSSPLGGLLDHGTDALFVTLACGALAQLNLFNHYLAIFIAVAFLQYMLDSKALAGQALRTSQVGRVNGVAYFALVGTTIGLQVVWELLSSIAGPGYLLSWVTVLIDQGLAIAAWVLCATTTASILDRLVTLLRLNSTR